MVYIMLADGFGEIAAFTPLDLFRRIGIDVQTVGVTGKIVTGARGIPVVCDMVPWQTQPDKADMIYLPGAYPGVDNLAASPYIREALQAANANNRYIAALCAAPAVVLEPLGIIDGKRVTCIQGEEHKLIKSIYVDEHVVRDGNILTGRNAGAVFGMSIEMCSLLRGADSEDTARVRQIVNCMGK